MSQEIYDNLGCQTLPQDCGQSGVVWRVNDARMRAWRIGLRFLSDNRHNVGIGTVSVKVIRQTRPDSVTEQMAEQEDSAATEADLEQSGAFALDPHNLVTNGFDNPPARLGQLWFGTDMRTVLVRPSTKAMMSFKNKGWLSGLLPYDSMN